MHNRVFTAIVTLMAGSAVTMAPLVGGSAPAGATPANAHLAYYGGRVIPNVDVIQVLYGPGSYAPEVLDPSPTDGSSIASFYSGVTHSAYLDGLAEFDTPAQVIGKGSFRGQVQINPSATGSIIDDSQIQAELSEQLSAGHLPQPTANTLYALYFPAGVTITMGGGSSGNTFCAYHGTVPATSSTPEVYYDVVPDFTSGGETSGCGTGTRFQNETYVSSAELVDAVTDPEVGVATNIAAPLAWYDVNNGESADICGGQQDYFVGADGRTYMVAASWSNALRTCTVAGRFATDFSITTSPWSAAVTAGSTTTASVATSAVSGYSGTISLSATGLPSGATATFTPTSVAGGSTSTMAISVPGTTSAGTYEITVGGSDGSHQHSALLTLTVNPPQSAPTLTGPTSITLTTGKAVSPATYTASGAPRPTLSATGSLPSGVKFTTDPFNGSVSLSGTPAAGSQGTYTVHMVATNGVSPNAGLTVTITVTTQTCGNRLCQ